MSAANPRECVGREIPNQVGFRLFPVSFPRTRNFLSPLALPLLVCDTWLEEKCRVSYSHFPQGLIWSTVPQSSPFTHTRWWSISSRAVLQRRKLWDTHQATPRGVQPLPLTPFMGRWLSYACHMPQNLFGYLSPGEEILKLVLAMATVCKVFATSNLSQRASSPTPFE